MTHEALKRITVACAALLVLWAEAAAARTLQQIRNEGSLRVGVALATPWALRTSGNELVGFEVDVARRLAADLEVDPVIIPYEFSELVPALETGEIDIVAAGFTITADRALHVNFSDPYATSGVALATNLETTADVELLGDLNDPEYTIAAVSDSVGLELARRHFARAEVREFEDADAAGRALVAGDVDGFLEEEPAPTYLALENPERVDVPLSSPLLETKSAFAIAKGDPDFLAFLDAWIVARRSDTWLPMTHDYWFNSLEWREAIGNVEQLP